jgi:putative hydrolase of the HAD superfamily
MLRAVFLDALGTLIELEPPWVYLRERVPSEVDDRRLVAAVRAEMDYYREHAHEGRDPASLAELRRRCAEVLSGELGTEVTAEELVEAVRFNAYPDAAPALGRLRDRDLRLVVVSNWDCSLPSVLERCGLGGLIDGAVSSAESGARKPDPAIFAAALRRASCQASEALHVGDTPEEDLDGARAAGIRALLIDRDGHHQTGRSSASPAERPRTYITSLEEIEEHL